MRTGACSFPPKTIIAVNVGVTGHRALPYADVAALSCQIGGILDYVRNTVLGMAGELAQFYSGEEPAFRILSMLAEGSDQIAAECALGLGYRLQCPLPMQRAAYEATFASQSGRKAFRGLLGRAERVFTIACGSSVPDRAFQNGGQVLLGHSDILIAVWDGSDSGKIGGTNDVIELAMQQDIPVLWVDSAAPHGIRFLYGERDETHWQDGIRDTLRDMLAPAGASENRGAAYFPAAYFKENTLRNSQAGLYRGVISLLSHRSGNVHGEDGREEPAATGLHAHFLCADTLAMRYGETFRSAGVLRQLLPFLASIGLAVAFYISLIAGPGTAPASLQKTLDLLSAGGLAVQAVCFVAIIALSRIEKKRHWQQKFIDYRMLSEMLRLLEHIRPAGLVIRGIRIPAYNSHVNVSWVNWQFRAIVREAGLPQAELSQTGLMQCFGQIKGGLLEKQILYHGGNTKLMFRISSRLEKAGIGIYYAGIAVTVLRALVFWLTTGIRIVPLAEQGKLYLSKLFNMLSMVVPLFSSLAFGLSAQEGFDRIRMRSDAMLGRLEALAGQMDRISTVDYSGFMKLSQQVTDLILSEFTDWNAFIRTKPISDH